MHYVYLIKSKSNPSFTYTGNTKDLQQRLKQHDQGQVYSSKKHAPFELIYYEAYSCSKDALEREHKLKHHGSAIGHLKSRLKNSLLIKSQKGGV